MRQVSPPLSDQSIVRIWKHTHKPAIQDLVKLLCFYSDVPFFLFRPWFKDRSSSNAFTMLHCVSLCVCVCVYIYSAYNGINVSMGLILHECVRNVIVSLSIDCPPLFAWGELWKVEKNVLYNIHKFQTWSNDLKRRGPAGLRDLPCFPYLPLPSSLCPKKHPNSHLLWRRVDRTVLAPASCAAGYSFCQIPAQEKPLVQSLSDRLDTRGGLLKALARGNMEP